MTEESLLKTEQKTVAVQAGGEKYENAVAGLFTNLRKQVYEDLAGKPLINLKAVGVYFDDIDVKKTTERFLFLFWPREKRYYTIKARIVVVIDFVDLKKEDIK